MFIIRHSKKRGVAQLASVLRSGRRGREFESRHPDKKNRLKLNPIFCFNARFIPFVRQK